MFINKLREKSNSTKMSSYINLFLKTEITCIPKLLEKYIGDYYSNALCNGATWVFLLWCVLHVIFDKIIDVFLRKLRYREYVRMRLKNCLWYLGFYGTALAYSRTTLAQNEMELFNFKKMHVPSSSSLPSQVIGYTLISTFYLHSSLWEGLRKSCFISMCSYFFLFATLVSSYILRIEEMSFSLTALIGIAQVILEFTRCCFTSSIHDSFISKLIMGTMYFATFATYVIIYIIVIPLTFVIPFGLNIMSDYPNILVMFLFTNMVLWLMTEIYQSILLKFVDHWFYHEGTAKEYYLEQCLGGFLECSLFPPRNDDSFNLQILREETKCRETKMMSMRKPKNKSMLIQTLKCMVALKRKISEKRLSESSDSDDSGKSEDSDLRTSENTDDDTGEQLSDQEESDDEESGSQETVIEAKKVKVVKFKEPDEFDDIKSAPEDKDIDFHKPDNDKWDISVKAIEELNVKPEESIELKKPNENKRDDTKQPVDQIDCTKPSVDTCDKKIKSIELNVKAETAENKSCSSPEPKYDRIVCDSLSNSDIASVKTSNINYKCDDTAPKDYSKPDNSDKGNTDVAPIETAIIDELKKIGKCETKKTEDENVNVEKPDRSNDDVKDVTSVKLEEPKDKFTDSREQPNLNKPVEEPNVEVEKENLGEGSESQVSEKDDASINDPGNVAAPIILKDEANAQIADEQTDLESKKDGCC